MNIFIIHGSNGSRDSHWYPWLKSELEKRKINVFLLQFPVGEKQTLQNWLSALAPYEKYLDGSIMVGHSLGAPFILGVLNEKDVKLKAAFLVSGFIGKLEVDGEPNLNNFSDKQFDWKKIRKRCGHFCIIHSDDDPYVPLQKAQELSKKLGVDLIVIEGGEHFRKQSGFEKFDFLLKKIEEQTK